MPPKRAPPTAAIPPMTANNTMGRPFRKPNVCGLTELSCPAYRAPPSPAMPAESVKTWSFVVARFTPR